MLGSAIDKPARARALRMMNHLLAVRGEQAAVFEILDFLWGVFFVRLKPSFHTIVQKCDMTGRVHYSTKNRSAILCDCTVVLDDMD